MDYNIEPIYALSQKHVKLTFYLHISLQYNAYLHSDVLLWCQYETILCIMTFQTNAFWQQKAN